MPCDPRGVGRFDRHLFRHHAICCQTACFDVGCLQLLAHGPRAKTANPIYICTYVYDSDHWLVGAQSCPFGHYGMDIPMYHNVYIQLRMCICTYARANKAVFAAHAVYVTYVCRVCEICSTCAFAAVHF